LVAFKYHGIFKISPKTIGAHYIHIGLTAEGAAAISSRTKAPLIMFNDFPDGPMAHHIKVDTKSISSIS
jgi:hypothetical protein